MEPDGWKNLEGSIARLEAFGAPELTGGFLHGSQAPDGQEAPTCA